MYMGVNLNEFLQSLLNWCSDAFLTKARVLVVKMDQVIPCTFKLSTGVRRLPNTVCYPIRSAEFAYVLLEADRAKTS